MYHRLICAILAALMPLLLAAPAFAQGDAPAVPVLCGDLSDEDCAILEGATAAAQNLTSYAAGMSMEIGVSGVPDLPVDPMRLSLLITGRFAYDETAHQVMQRMNTLQGMSAEDMQALADELPDLMLDLYRGMNFDMTMTYTLPPELAAEMSADSEVTFPETMSFAMRMIDGMMYVNIGELRDLIPDAEDTFTADWMGMDYIGLMEMQMEQGMGGAENPAMMGMMGGLGAAEMMKEMEQFVTIERLDDVDLNGQEGAVFAYTPDVIGFLTSDTFTDFVNQMVAQAAAQAGEDAPSAAEMRQATSMISFMAPMLFRDLEISAQTTIGLDDAMTHSSVFNLTWDLTSLMQFAAMTDPALAETLGDAEPVITLDFTMDLSDFNADMTFETPEDVQMIPLDEMMPVDQSAVF